jgi:hypothetical protein
MVEACRSSQLEMFVNGEVVPEDSRTLDAPRRALEIIEEEKGILERIGDGREVLCRAIGSSPVTSLSNKVRIR